MPHVWHGHAMPRVRISTTVDQERLEATRRVAGHVNDASLVDAALDALIAANRRVELDASYAAYDETPVEAPDEWGDLASFRSAAASS
jgi:hypothetical protein